MLRSFARGGSGVCEGREGSAGVACSSPFFPTPTFPTVLFPSFFLFALLGFCPFFLFTAWGIVPHFFSLCRVQKHFSHNRCFLLCVWSLASPSLLHAHTHTHAMAAAAAMDLRAKQTGERER